MADIKIFDDENMDKYEAFIEESYAQEKKTRDVKRGHIYFPKIPFYSGLVAVSAYILLRLLSLSHLESAFVSLILILVSIIMNPKSFADLLSTSMEQ